MNDSIMYIKCSIKRFVFKFIKKAYNVKKKVRKYMHNIIYL